MLSHASRPAGLRVTRSVRRLERTLRKDVIYKMIRHAAGSALVDGPRALVPPGSVDEFGWLEADCRIVLIGSGYLRAESVAVFVDNTVNRSRGFLKPMIRHAVWNRARDLRRDPHWQSVRVAWGTVSDWPTTRRLVKELQTGVRNLPFVAYGISRARRGAPINYVPRWGSFRVEVSNGAQYLKLSSPWLRDDPFSETVYRVAATLTRQLVRITPRGWVERYERDLSQRRRHWDWKIGEPIGESWSPTV